MLSPAARQAAADRRCGADLPDTSHDFPGHNGDQLQGNLPREGGDQVNGDANRPDGVAAPIIANGHIDNKRLRTALESLMTAYSMTIREEFVQHLDQIVMAGDAVKELLSAMIDKASKGEDPASQSYMDIPPTQVEIAKAATRLAAAKAAIDEASATNTRLATEIDKQMPRKLLRTRPQTMLTSMISSK